MDVTNAWFVRTKLYKLTKISVRISCLKINLKNEKFIFLGCYLSCDERVSEELELVNKIAREEQALGNKKIFVLGDFNADLFRDNTND